jgi:DNA polymerase-3 subunit alpha
VIRIAVDIAGYTMGHADKLRKAMGKKKLDIMEKEKPLFIQGAMANGYPKEKVEEIWEKLLKFANYGFNKAHAASYAMVSYWTAYLKAHYPLHFMAALLESDLNNFDRIAIDLEECGKLNIDVYPPDINKSNVKFKIEGDHGIRFGLAAVKNIGSKVVQVIVDERNENGDYKHLDDLYIGL